MFGCIWDPYRKYKCIIIDYEHGTIKKKIKVFVTQKNKNLISILILFHSDNILTSLKQDVYTRNVLIFRSVIVI